MDEVAILRHTIYKLFQIIKIKGHTSSYKIPAQFYQSCSVNETINFYSVATWSYGRFKATMAGHLNRVCRKHRD